MSEAVARLEPGLELGGELFNLYRETFRIGKGALLLHDRDESAYLPWATTGFDETTTHRLRVPEGFLRSLPPIGQGRPVSLTRQEAVPLGPYFSMREFGLIERLLLIPFPLGEEVVALLAVARAEALDLAARESYPLLTQSALRAAPLIRRSRSMTGSGAPAPRGEPANRIHQILASALSAERHVLFVRLELADLLSALPSGDRAIDPYRLRKDMVRVLASMVAGGGELIPLASSTLLLSLTGRTPHDERLVLHQVCALIGTLFATRVLESQLHWRSWTYPKEGCTPDELIAEIIP